MKRAISDDQKEQRRLSLLEASLDVFFEKGFAAAKIDDISARAGVSKGAVYLYFHSKQDLLEALLDTYAQPNIDALIESAALADPMQAFDTIARTAAHIVRDTPMPRLAKILISEAPAFPQFAELYRKRMAERGLGALADLIERGVEQNIFRPCDTAAIAKLILAPFLLSMVWTVVFEPVGAEKLDVESLVRTQLGMLARSLATGDLE